MNAVAEKRRGECQERENLAREKLAQPSAQGAKGRVYQEDFARFERSRTTKGTSGLCDKMSEAQAEGCLVDFKNWIFEHMVAHSWKSMSSMPENKDTCIQHDCKR